MPTIIENDQRLDPRVKRALSSVPSRSVSDIDSRERLVEISNSEAALALGAKLKAVYARFDTAEVAPQLPHAVVGTRDRAVPSWSERLCGRGALDGGQRSRARDRPGSCHRCG